MTPINSNNVGATDKTARELFQEKVSSDPVLNNAIGWAFWVMLTLGFSVGAVLGCGIGAAIMGALK